MPGDHAIESFDQDKLGRGPFVRALAQTVRGLDASKGAVIGLVGPWGLGKSSALNMLAEELASDPQLVTVKFEPWLFSGAGELLSLFFADMAEQLRGESSRFRGERLADLAELLDLYGQSLGVLKWVPVAGPWLDRLGSITKLVKNVARKRMDEANKLTNRRKALTDALESRPTPIVVIIDEIDRLRPNEVRDIFQLVRLTGQFPNLIYVLAFDRQRVEAMLAEAGIEGRDYLEKIIEIVFNLPPVSRVALDRVFASELSALLEGIETGPFQQERWPDILARVVRPLMGDLRDVRRYLAALPGTLTSVGREVALVDVLALEALRILLPDVHEALVSRTNALTQVAVNPQVEEAYRAELAAIIEAAGTNPVAVAAVEALLHLLFSATDQFNPGGLHYDASWAATWRKDRRVASRQVLDVYLEHVLGPGVAPVDLVERVVANLADERALTGIFAQVDDEVLEDILERLEAFHKEFPIQAVEPATSALLGLYPRMQAGDNPLDVGGDARIDRVVLRLLRVVESADARRDLVERVVSRQSSLHARMRVLLRADKQQLLAEADTARLLSDVYGETRIATAERLASEPHVLWLLYNTVQDNPDDRKNLDEQLGKRELMAALLRDAVGTTSSWQIGSRAITRQPALNWDGLVAVCGNETRLSALLERFRGASAPAELNEREITQALRLIEERMQAGPPAPRWSRPANISEFNTSRGTDILSVRDEPAAELVLRATSLHTTSPERAKETNLLTNRVHGTLKRYLIAGEMVSAAREYCAQHGATLALDQDVTLENDNLNVHMAVARRTVTSPDAPVVVTVRVAITSPGVGDTYVRVIAEVWVAQNSANASDTERARNVSIGEARDLLAAALGTTAEIAATALPEAYNDHIVPHTGTEIRIACGELTQSTDTPALSDLIDLEQLGQSTSAHQYRDGDYAADSNAAINTAEQRRALVNHALRYMAGAVWRYPEADDHLLSLLQPRVGE